ncbi:hypothetical protein Taro_010343 [Colocasia esculenta]|uniref:SCP domain-containing protein n=1 Tax=Colocasia esculenta TaxID=4460 RepID=A0A843U995_COLES|nr:hypothetical protein [Colocasia esculenta]
MAFRLLLLFLPACDAYPFINTRRFAFPCLLPSHSSPRVCASLPPLPLSLLYIFFLFYSTAATTSICFPPLRRSPAHTSTPPADAQNTPSDWVNLHNATRCSVGVAPVSWDNTVAAYAWWYANQWIGDCQLKHSGGSYGENLFVGWGRELSIADAVKAWVDERQHYNCRSNSCASEQCSNGGIFITCNYSPPGTSLASALTHAVVCHRRNNSPPSIVNSAFPNPDHRTPPFGILDSALYREEKERLRALVLLDIFWTRPRASSPPRRAPARPTFARCCRCYFAHGACSSQVRTLLPLLLRSRATTSHRVGSAYLPVDACIIPPFAHCPAVSCCSLPLLACLSICAVPTRSRANAS